MPKTVIIVLNIISATPIIFYPVMFVSALMVFAVPGVTKSATGLVSGVSMLLYPVLVVVGIILSRKYNSVIWAVVACIPIIVMVGFMVKNIINNSKVPYTQTNVLDNAVFKYTYNGKEVDVEYFTNINNTINIDESTKSVSSYETEPGVPGGVETHYNAKNNKTGMSYIYSEYSSNGGLNNIFDITLVNSK